MQTIKQFKRLCTLPLVGLLLVSAQLAAHEHKSKSSVTLKQQEIKPGLHVLYGHGGFTGGNVLVSSGEDGVFMIDTATSDFLEQVKTQLQKISKKPVKFLINTHVHGDHTANNAAFGGAHSVIIAHDSLRERLQAKGSAAVSLPVLTTATGLSLHLNGDQAELIHLPSAHTDGDIAVHFKGANVLHTGDILFNGLFPFIDLSSGGNVKGYYEAQKKLIGMINKDTIVVPGHGPITDKKGLIAANDMLGDAIRIVQRFIDEGLSEEQIVKANPLNLYHDDWNWGFITTEKMTRQLYQGLSAK